MFDALAQYISSPWVYNSFSVIYAVTIISIVGVVLSENRNPVKSLAWVTILLLLPMVGLLLYIFFGRSIKNTRMISRRNRRRLKRRAPMRHVDFRRIDLSRRSLQLIRLGRSLTDAYFYPNNGVEIFTDGESKLKALLRDLESAKEYIDIQYYIIENDASGRRLADVLCERARAGVKVRLVYDHVGSFSAGRKFFRRMKDAGVAAYPFFKVTFPPFGTRINWRNHRKLAVIDGRVGYIGGMNIADRYIDGGKKFGCWRDTHLRVTGDAVSAIEYSFAIDWNFMGQPLIEDYVRTANSERRTTNSERVGMQMLTSGPTSQWSNIAFMFNKAIGSARRRVYVQTPYFLPTEGLLRSLQTASLSGVDVRIMMPRHSDAVLLTHASFSYISECLQAGIKIYLYEAGMLHAKTIIVDDELSSVGSSNFDFRSFEHNFEANMFIYSREVNARMLAIFHDDEKNCQRVNAAEWRRRPIFHKALQSVTRLLSPIL